MKLFGITLLTLITTLFFSCSQEDNEVLKSSEAIITSFKIGNEEGVINESEKTIAISVAYGTDVGSLMATYTKSAGATIAPDPSKAIDYSKAKTFTVTAADGKTKKEYAVTVTVEKSTEAIITNFKIGDEVGVINESEETIAVRVPYGTNVGSLMATHKKSAGATIAPDPSKAIDYSKAKTFTVTAADGKVKTTYTVTVIIEKNTKAEIINFKIGDEVGVINESEKTIAVSVPYGTNVGSLMATYRKSAGATIAPNPSKARDYSSPVVYKVTGEDGKVKTYTVTVSIKVTDADLFDVVHGEIKKLGNNANLNHLDMSRVTSMKDLFKGDKAFNGDLSKWDVSRVTDMSSMFEQATAFNSDISSWVTSRVTTMEGMFYEADAFNKDISGWDVSKVTNMKSMFERASSFNGDLSSWVVSSVTTMADMFANANAFNKDISGWDVSSVTNMSYMFQGASSFNGNLLAWNVSRVTKMSSMFEYAIAFNGKISKWVVSSVTDMGSMFERASSFNKDISGWDVSKVTNMSAMFKWAQAFDQDLSNWKVCKITSKPNFFDRTAGAVLNPQWGVCPLP